MARRYTEIIAWQLADEIRQIVFTWTASPAFKADGKAREQIDDAINSVCRNIAEGFAGSHGEFARFLAIARRSLNEVTDCIRSAELKGYIAQTEAAQARVLIKRLFPAIARLRAYLLRTPDPLDRNPGRKQGRHQ
jgi:four helix bundle protein